MKGAAQAFAPPLREPGCIQLEERLRPVRLLCPGHGQLLSNIGLVREQPGQQPALCRGVEEGEELNRIAVGRTNVVRIARESRCRPFQCICETHCKSSTASQLRSLVLGRLMGIQQLSVFGHGEAIRHAGKVIRGHTRLRLVAEAGAHTRRQQK